MESPLENCEDRISKIYSDKTIFVTGGTGFLGKVLIEKLLRLCPKFKKIYVLVRPKRGKTASERLRELFKSPLFNLVKKENGLENFGKVEAIQGDALELELGLSPSDREKLTKEVEMIYHCAATIRFDEGLKKAILLNVRGTQFTLNLAKECENLEIFCHISTSYCHLNQKILYEKVYPAPADPHQVIAACEWIDDTLLNKIQSKILKSYPNSYAYSKALAEELVLAELNNLPIIIARPSIITPLMESPIPGWTDSINGPNGLFIGAGKGVIRTMYVDPDIYGDFIPCDYAVNALMLYSYDFITNGKNRIFHLTSSSEHKISWEEILNLGREIILELPFNGVAWYPGGSMKTNRHFHLLCFYLFQWIPAIFVDTLLFCLGIKPVLMRVQRRIYKGFEIFEYYATRQWDFDNSRTLELRSKMNTIEKKKYTLQVEAKHETYYTYFKHCIHCSRLYLLNETDDQIPAAKRHMFVMWCVDIFTKVFFAGLVLYYVYNKTKLYFE